MTAIAKIVEHAGASPDQTAVVHDGVSYGYARFARWIERTRRHLAGQALPADRVVIICVANLLDAWVVLLALRALRFTTVAVTTAARLGALRVRAVGAVVTMAAEDLPNVEKVAAGAGHRIVRIPADLRDEAGDDAPPMIADTPPNGSGHILLTSGTTGETRMVLRAAESEARAIPERAAKQGISGRSIVYVADFGLWTAGGYRWALMTWTVGGTVVIEQSGELHRPLSRHSLSHIFMTPAMLHALVWASKGELRRNDASRLLVTGGTPSTALWQIARQRITRDVSSMLASTEARMVGMTPLENPEDLLWHRIDPACEVQVVDAADHALPAGQEGAVRIRVDDLSGYLDDEAATRACFRDGYFYPGDIGVFGPDGRLALRGRATDVVNVLGIKIATGGIEHALRDRLGVEAVCIVSIPGSGGDDEIHLVIQSGRQVDRAELEAAADALLGTIKCVPVHIDFVAAMPRNDMGKVLRRTLREQLASPGRTRGSSAP